MLIPEAAAPLFAWTNERHAIWIRRDVMRRIAEAQASGVRTPVTNTERDAWGNDREDRPKLWKPDYATDDPILREYRSCNVYRELDRVTVWIREHIREPFADHQHLWFMLAIARMINWPPTLEMLLSSTRATWPSQDGFRPDFMTTALEAWKAAGKKVETGAYMIRAESDPKAEWYNWSKQRYVAEVVLGKLWERRENWQRFLEGTSGATMRTVWEALQDKHYTGWGPFMAYQVCVDLRHTRYLRDAPDIQTWAAVGPGSARGLNRIHGRRVDAPLRQEQALDEMLELRELSLRPGALAPWMVPIDLSDIQNCLCEFDKYERVRLGEGRPRSKYVPGRGW